MCEVMISRPELQGTVRTKTNKQTTFQMLLFHLFNIF